MPVTQSFAGANKVAPLPLPPRTVARPRLHQQLTEAVDVPLTLVAAGPGFGKTALLASWRTEYKGPSAWLSLDPADNSAKRLWSLVGEALVAAGVIADTGNFAALPHDPTDTGRFLAALQEALPGPGACTLIMDDAHVLTDSVALAEIDAIVRHGFPYLRLVLSARSDPLLPLHRYRLSGQMFELRAVDLAMTKLESQALLASHGVSLAARDLALLCDRTEGWPAGLRLSAMSMSGSRNPGRFVTQLALDHGSVGEYLMVEVLDRQPEDVRRLLIQTSFLNEITGPLATAVASPRPAPACRARRSRSAASGT